MKVRWWLFIARRKRKHEQYAEALELLHKVIAVQPQRALAFLQAGYCLAKLNKEEEALRSYARALEIAPNGCARAEAAKPIRRANDISSAAPKGL